MATKFERKRDAAFAMLARLGFVWNGKSWDGQLSDEQMMLLTGDKLYECLVQYAPTDDDSDERAEQWTAYDLWALETWEKTTDYFARHQNQGKSDHLQSVFPNQES